MYSYEKIQKTEGIETYTNERNWCDQVLLTKWVSIINSATSKLIRHNEARTHLDV